MWSAVSVALLLLSLLARLAAIHEQPLPWCSPQNLPLDSVHVNLTRYLQGDGSFAFGYRHCRMRDFEGRHFADALKAMRGNHLVFFGDSLSRYTYTSLAYFLVHRRWTAPFADASPDGFSVCSEFEFKSWSRFYPWVNQRLNTYNQSATKAEMARHPFVSYEVCDCRRGDKGYKFDNIVENRHLRLVPVLPQSHLAKFGQNERNESLYLLQGNVDDTSHDVRVSYVQWFGGFNMHLHKAVSAVPRSRKGFERYVELVNRRFCSTDFNATFFPLSISCEEHRVRSDRQPHERSDLRTALLARAQGICPREANASRLLERPCHAFGEIFPLLNATHVLLNSGMWKSLVTFEHDFLDRTVRGARFYLSPPSCRAGRKGSPSQPCSASWSLRPIVWRETYAPSVVDGQYGDYDREQEQLIARDYRRHADADGTRDFDVFRSTELTLWCSALFQAQHQGDEAPTAVWDDVWLSVDFLRRKNLLRTVRAHPLARDYGADSWADVAASDEEAFEDRLRGVPARSALGQQLVAQHVRLAVDVKPVYEDRVHFSPYVYNEVNKVFLAATVPVGA